MPDVPDWLVQMPIAHRGLHGEGAPENSLEAIERAIEHGYAVEVDVRLSADGVPMVFHDESLERLTGMSSPIHEVPVEELGDLQLEGTAERIPRLSTVLDEVDGRAPVLVELKNWQAPGRLEQKVRRELDGYDGAFAVQSFNPRSIAWFGRQQPEWPRGQVSSGFDDVPIDAWQRFLLKRLLVTPLSRPDFVAYQHENLPYVPVSLHRWLGLPVLAWTVRSPDEHERVDPYVDNVIFEGYEP